MKIKREYVAYGILLISIAVVLIMLMPFGREIPPKMVFDVRTVTALQEANAVVVRFVYPYEYPGPAVAAGEAAIVVFNAMGKRTIVQAVDMNKGVCYTNEGNYEQAKTIPLRACLDTNLPVVVILESSTPSVVMHGNTMEIRGPPNYIQAVTLYALDQVFPGASETYSRVQSELKRVAESLRSIKQSR